MSIRAVETPENKKGDRKMDDESDGDRDDIYKPKARR